MMALQSLFDQCFVKIAVHTHEEFKTLQDPSTLYDTMQTISQMAVQLSNAFKSEEKTIFSPDKMKLLQNAVSELLYDVNQSLRFTQEPDVLKNLYSKRHDIEQAFKKMKELITIVE